MNSSTDHIDAQEVEPDERWTLARRQAQRERAQVLVAEGRFGGPGRGQGRKPRPRLDIGWSVICPKCGTDIHGKDRA